MNDPLESVQNQLECCGEELHAALEWFRRIGTHHNLHCVLNEDDRAQFFAFAARIEAVFNTTETATFRDYLEDDE